MERGNRKILTGQVVSVAMDKTIVVLVKTDKLHSLYGKRILTSKKYKVHDEKNKAGLGDKVKIMETRLLSKTKYFRLVEVREKAK